MISRSLRSGAIAVSAAALIATMGLAACGGGASNTTAAPTAAAAAPVHFVNSQANATSPTLASHYIDFSFDYPGNWTLDPSNGTGTAANFVGVERDDPSGAIVEKFAVGSYSGTGDAAADQAQIPQLLQKLEGEATSMPGYKQLSLGEATTVDGISGSQVTFTATPQLNGKPANIFGRIIILPGPAGQPNGVVLVMMGTDASGELHGIADLGTKGQLPTILNSFKFGTPATTPAPAPAGAVAPGSGSTGASDNAAQ